jgi:methionine sulfoxide reductase catalytic subunit
MPDNQPDVPQLGSNDADGQDRSSGTTGVASAESAEMGELEAVELELEGYRTEIHHAHDRIDPDTYGGGLDNSRRASAPRLRV